MAAEPRTGRGSGRASAFPRWALVALVLAVGATAALYQTLLGDLAQDTSAGLQAALPRLMLGAVVLLAGVVAAGVLRAALRRTMPRARERRAVGAVVTYAVYAVAVLLAVSVAAGQLATLALSLGLVGFGLTMALQTPILSAVGWLLVQSKGLYAPGDRISVGEVRGDVMAISVLTTTLWEFGTAEGRGDLPSGRRVTFPNKLVLEQPVRNFTADFPYVWDDVTVPVAMEGDWRLAKDLLLRIADEVVGNAAMAARVEEYERILARSFAPYTLSRTPTVGVRLEDSWAALRLRYLVHVDEASVTRTRISERVLDDFARHPQALPPVYPRIQPMRIDGTGRPVDLALGPPPRSG